MLPLSFKWMWGSDYLPDSHLGVPLPTPTSNRNEEKVMHFSHWKKQATTWSGVRVSACQAWTEMRKSGFSCARCKSGFWACSCQYGQGTWEFKEGFGESEYAVINNGWFPQVCWRKQKMKFFAWISAVGVWLYKFSFCYKSIKGFFLTISLSTAISVTDDQASSNSYLLLLIQ